MFRKRNHIPEGTKFGKLTVKRYSHRKRTEAMWECVCECGNLTYVSSHYLKGRKSHRWNGYEEISLEFWNVAKRNAIKRGLQFDINIEYGWGLFLEQNKKCALSGLDLYFSRTTKSFDGNASLDRIDSEIGYVIGNVQWVHKNVNKMKNNYTQESFLDLIKKIYEHNYQHISVS